MATIGLFYNAKIFIAGFQLAGDFESIELAYSAEILDETTFGDTTRVHRGGLKVADVSGSGFWSADATTAQSADVIDRILFGIVGSDDQILTLFTDGITEGSTANDKKGYAMKGVVSEFNIGGTVGALLPFNFAAMGAGIEA